MNIPDKAVEAAARAHLTSPWETYSKGDQEYHLDVARASLEAAAPFIAAQALDDLEAHLRAGLAATRNGGEQHLHEDALIMLDAYRGNL